MRCQRFDLRRVFKSVFPTLVLLILGYGCTGERLLSSAGSTSTAASVGREMQNPATAPANLGPDMLAYPWGTVRLISIRLETPPATLKGAPLGAKLLSPALVEMELTGERPGRRTMAISGWTSGKIGEARATLSDGQGNQLWSMGWGADRPGEHLVFESAPGVELRMLQAKADSTGLTETYLFRLGPMVRRCTLTYDPKSTESAERALAEFGRFYIRGTSLDDNFDGRLTVSLLKDRKFITWAANQVRQPKDPYADISDLGQEKTVRDVLCGLAEVCSFLKCTFGGGMANPVCDACAGAAFVCALLDLFGW